jgi:hypothetical protein
MLRTFANKFINFMSFDREVRHLVNVLNRKIEQPVGTPPLKSHPSGFKKGIARDVSYCHSYIISVQQLELEKMKKARLPWIINTGISLCTECGNASHTARLQAALMKEVVKNRGNSEAMEFMTVLPELSGHLL